MKVLYMVLGLTIGIMWIVFLCRACSPSMNGVDVIQQPPKVVRVYSSQRQSSLAAARNDQALPPSRKLFDAWYVWTLVFLVLDSGLWLYASHSVNRICQRQDRSSSEKLQLIATEDIVFDLPLYIGLFGTVVGFVLIAHGFASSRDAAYVSTIIGILASAGMRLFILRPKKRRLQESV